MDDQQNSDIADLKSKIEQTKDTQPTQLPFNLFDKQENRTTKLIANSGDVQSISGRRRWFEFSFKESALISRVVINVDGYSDNKEFEIQWKDDEGRSHLESAKPVGNVIHIAVNDLCRSISFRPPYVFASKANIQSIVVEGVERRNISTYLDTIADIERYKNKVVATVNRLSSTADVKLAKAGEADRRLAESEKEISKLKGEIVKTKKNIDDLTRTRSELILNNNASEAAAQEIAARIESAKSAESALQNNVNILKKDIADKSAELKELKDNINLFPSEISGFVNQGSENIKLYTALVIIPALILLSMTIQLLDGAVNLTTIISEQNGVDIELLVVSRLPYVTVAIAIITACYKICHAFVVEIFKINRQRLSLTKMSIISKDVSAASANGLSLTDEDLFRLRAELKMQLLREHLKDYLSKDTVIKLPTKIFGIFDRKDERAES